MRQEGPQSLNTQTGDTVVMMMVRGYRIQYHAMGRQSERETLVCGGNIKTLTRRDKEDSDIEIQTKRKKMRNSKFRNISNHDGIFALFLLRSKI